MKTYDLLPFGFGRPAFGNAFPATIFEDMNRLMDNFGGNTATDLIPRLDVAETPKAITLQAELPGMTEKDIDVQVQGNVVTIKGEKNLEREEKDTNWHMVERRSGSFSRSLQLPFEPEADAVDASVKDGVLKVSITKPANNGAKKIAVKAAH
jgi:HSP20 family protein